MTSPAVKSLTDFYATGDDSLLRLWERGQPRGDSTTPSVSSPDYQRWMREHLRALLGPEGTLISAGCGNAFIEAGLAREGVRVTCVDALPEAIEVAADKGLDAVLGDVRTWTPEEPVAVVYADGLLGHLHDGGDGVRAALVHFRSWLRPGGTIVVSNDMPPGREATMSAPGVHGFTWLSDALLCDALETAGFSDIESQQFIYARPITGDRTRAIVWGRA
jgi:SAM-dependent methyltransferase